MDRIYIIAITTDLNGKPCRQLGTDGIFWVDNRLSMDNKIEKGIEQIKKYQNFRPSAVGFILSTIRNAPDYVDHYFKVE